jgi:hypothetical protein
MEEILFVVIIALIIFILYQNTQKTNNLEKNVNANSNINSNSNSNSNDFAQKQVDKTTELSVLNDPNNPDNFLELNQSGEPVFTPFIYDRMYNPYFYPYYSYYSYEPRPLPVYNVEYDLYNPFYRNYRYYNREYNHLKRVDEGRRDGRDRREDRDRRDDRDRREGGKRDEKK